MKNKDIREYAKRKGVFLWQIADGLGVSDSTLFRKIRKEFSPGTKQRIIKIIDRLAEEQD